MLSKDMYRTFSTESDTIKVRKVIAGTTTGTAGVIYYWKPKTKCKLIGAELVLLTNTGNGKLITISRTAITDSDLQRGEITVSTNITESEIANSDMLIYTLPNSALTTTEFEPQATISDDFLTVDPDASGTDLTSYGNAVRIDVADLGTGAEVMTGMLTLEYLPII